MKFKSRSNTPKDSPEGSSGVVGARPKGAKSKALKPMKLPKKAGYVLTIGDEGAILAYLKGGAVENRWFVADASTENKEVFTRAIAGDSSAPLTIILDTVDQHYSQQNLPPVSQLSVKNLLKRRASREFGRAVELQGNYFIDRGASKEWNYMMYALEMSEHTQGWMDWVLEQPNPPKGIRVLPIEMTALINKLAQSEAEGRIEGDAPSWRYLVSYNKVSGVRQVILKDGKMVFTRLGQPLEGDASTEAGAIEQEVISTVEYLKRIGLRSAGDLHLYIVAGQEITNVIDGKRMGIESHSLLTPYDAARLVGWENVVQPDDRFGDVLMAAFIVAHKKSKHVLWTKPLGKIRGLYMAIPAVRTIGALVVLGAIGYGALSAVDYVEHVDTVSQSAQKKTGLERQLAELKSQADIPPEDLGRILEVFDLYKALHGSKLSPDAFMSQVHWALTALPAHMQVQSVTWARPEGALDKSKKNKKKEPPKAGKEAPKGKPVEMKGDLNINILVPANIQREALDERTNSIAKKLAPYFPHYDFELEEITGVRSAQDSLDIDFTTPSVEIDTLTRVTLKATFSGTEYIPEPSFEVEK